MPINIVWDATILDTFQLCNLKYHRRFNLNKVPVGKGAVVLDSKPNTAPLDRGTVIHLAKEAYYKELQASHNWEKAMDRQLVAGRLAITKSDLDIAYGNFLLDSIERESSYWKNVDINYEILAVEQAFSYVLYEGNVDSIDIRVIMIGKIDLLVNDGPNYLNVPLDHKSHERDNGITEFTNQFFNYAYACQSYILLVNRIGLQKTLTDKERFKRIPLSYDPLRFDWWRKNTIKWALLYYDAMQEYSVSQDESAFAANLTSCNKYNKDCEYLEVCRTSGDSNKIYKLDVDFATTAKWDVSSALTTAGKE